ncbi:1-aminocyclopropane-1-carboxylate deaminase/D-cysteine desulfhydrase [Ichthyobacterium seriolicida]|uniref:1-aminocyclopropane-1-carboxylate deaminase n=1 Tax=Ichthyobacterium seriolicida TaxID=242600 RepID=A0A1J1EA30_9FLAO|nr:pyridoxal-phosphate dependent enzyme [Ichthyobacterium seriolicida]BAV94376.1 1-aminocyclopropane-1-carboxylate deaminase [Ichthyobacterium seriolicida]
MEVPIQRVTLPLFSLRGVNVFVKREDLIHRYISGNKYRKLKYNMLFAENEKYNRILSFGGAFSNHILALAYACKEKNISSVGVIRGEELADKRPDELNSTLRFCLECGMKLHFIDRKQYRDKYHEDFILSLRNTFGEFYLLPEGGSNNLAVKGCEEILDSRTDKFDVIFCAVGTGGTISGIINSAKKNQRVIGIPVLRGANFLEAEICKYLNEDVCQWSLNYNYSFGGYAKCDKRLLSFIELIENKTSIPLEPVYTGKVLYAIFDMIERNIFSRGTDILMIHTGGLRSKNDF